MEEKEQWKPIPGFPDYEVSNMGLVRSYKWKNRGPNAPHVLKPAIVHGYWAVVLRRNNKNHTFTIGRLVLLAFRGPCPEGCEVCHNDGDPTNDHLDNLRWDTHLANAHDAIRHGTITKIISEAQRCKIGEKYAQGNTTLRKLAAEYDVSHTTIHLIVKKFRSEP